METRRDNFVFCCVAVFCFWACASDSLYPESYIEVLILKSIKASLEDPNGVLNDWVGDEVDPCSWTRVTCSPDHLVIGLLLQNNNISGSIPSELGRLSKLQTLDLCSNSFTGEIPTSLAHLKRLPIPNHSLLEDQRIGELP
ncbi:hypothetical protein L1049_006330 [Liquidambar formosana]|uniref:Leucine-rich repeat-containing N-terminal plant-type domain-containing protein n=1 Tax=Liquidambar formosana TaxID=63359 RepID=A0AAP0RFR8_LIQFO